MKKVQVTYLGLNSLFGRVATKLLKTSPCIQKLRLYDDNELRETASHPNMFIGRDSLMDAVKNSNIVVIGDENYGLMESERLNLVAAKVVKYSEAILKYSPNAIIVVAASPLNILVPMVGHILGPDNNARLLGCTSVDTLRANRVLNELMKDTNDIVHVLPVVGGSSSNTRVPLFSQLHPKTTVDKDLQEKLLQKMEEFNSPHLQEIDAVQRAYTTVRFVHSLMAGMINCSPIPEIAMVKTKNIPDVDFFSLPILLGKNGVESVYKLPTLEAIEQELIAEATKNLIKQAKESLEYTKQLISCEETQKHKNDTDLIDCWSSSGERMKSNDSAIVEIHKELKENKVIEEATSPKMYNKFENHALAENQLCKIEVPQEKQIPLNTAALRTKRSFTSENKQKTRLKIEKPILQMSIEAKAKEEKNNFKESADPFRTTAIVKTTHNEAPSSVHDDADEIINRQQKATMEYYGKAMRLSTHGNPVILQKKQENIKIPVTAVASSIQSNDDILRSKPLSYTTNEGSVGSSDAALLHMKNGKERENIKENVDDFDILKKSIDDHLSEVKRSTKEHSHLKIYKEAKCMDGSINESLKIPQIISQSCLGNIVEAEKKNGEKCTKIHHKEMVMLQKDVLTLETSSVEDSGSKMLSLDEASEAKQPKIVNATEKNCTKSNSHMNQINDKKEFKRQENAENSLNKRSRNRKEIEKCPISFRRLDNPDKHSEPQKNKSTDVHSDVNIKAKKLIGGKTTLKRKKENLKKSKLGLTIGKSRISTKKKQKLSIKKKDIPLIKLKGVSHSKCQDFDQKLAKPVIKKDMNNEKNVETVNKSGNNVPTSDAWNSKYFTKSSEVFFKMFKDTVSSMPSSTDIPHTLLGDKKNEKLELDAPHKPSGLTQQRPNQLSIDSQQILKGASNKLKLISSLNHVTKSAGSVGKTARKRSISPDKKIDAGTPGDLKREERAVDKNVAQKIEDKKETSGKPALLETNYKVEYVQPVNTKVEQALSVSSKTLFEESSTIPILNSKGGTHMERKSMENPSFQNVNATSDKGKGDAINLIDFKVHKTTGTENKYCVQAINNKDTPHKELITDLKSIHPSKTTVSVPKMTISSKMIKQVNLGRKHTERCVTHKHDGVINNGKHSKLERICSIFKQIIVKDIEDKELKKMDFQLNPVKTLPSHVVFKDVSTLRASKLTALPNKPDKVKFKKSSKKKPNLNYKVSKMTGHHRLVKHNTKKIVNYFSKREHSSYCDNGKSIKPFVDESVSQTSKTTNLDKERNLNQIILYTVSKIK